MVEELLHDLLAVDFLGLGLVTSADAVPKYVGSYRLYVLGSYVTTALDKSMRPGRPR